MGERTETLWTTQAPDQQTEGEVMPNMIEIVNPEINRGKPPRNITKADIITVPVNYQRGSWNLGDMLNINSIGALWAVHNSLTTAKNKELQRKRAAHKS